MEGVSANQKGHTPLAVNLLGADGAFKGFTKFLGHFKVAVFKVIQAHSASRLMFYNIL